MLRNLKPRYLRSGITALGQLRVRVRELPQSAATSALSQDHIVVSIIGNTICVCTKTMTAPGSDIPLLLYLEAGAQTLIASCVQGDPCWTSRNTCSFEETWDRVSILRILEYSRRQKKTTTMKLNSSGNININIPIPYKYGVIVYLDAWGGGLRLDQRSFFFCLGERLSGGLVSHMWQLNWISRVDVTGGCRAKTMEQDHSKSLVFDPKQLL